MKIGIIGSGNIGGTAGTLWAQHGHEVMFSSRHPEELGELVQRAGPNGQVGTVAQAAAWGEVVLVAIPFGLYTTLPTNKLAGKTVIDATNYYPQRDGQIDLEGSTSSELIAHHLPGARLVKAFNTMYSETLRTAGRANDDPNRLALFLAGDDADAKQVVSQLIDQLGFAPVDTGGLRDGGRRQEPDTPIYNRPMNEARARELLAHG